MLCSLPRSLVIGLVSLCSVGLAGCKGGEPDDVPRDDGTGGAECSVAAQNNWVYRSLEDYYLFYDRVPTLDPGSYDSPEAVLEAGRFTERDPFSFLTDVGGNSLAFDQGRAFGLGFETRFDARRRVLLSLVQPLSPIGQAGVERGDRVVSIDGRDPVEVLRDRAYVRDRLVGTPRLPGNSTWMIEPRDGSAMRTVDLIAAEYGIQSVPYTSVLRNPSVDGTIGYLVFTSFLGTSEAELDTAFAVFAAQGVTELILDLRYNRGGFVRVAASLATRIAGNALAGTRLYDYRYNDKYRRYDYTLAFERVSDALDLSRVVVLTTVDTASSSEIVISGLAPYVEVVTVGSRTSGKPYIQSANDRCGARLFAVEAEGVNADRVSVFGGIEPTCPALDDLSADFGLNPAASGDGLRPEGMLGVALDVLSLGRCPAAPAAVVKTDGAGLRTVAAPSLLYPNDPRGYAIRDGSVPPTP